MTAPRKKVFVDSNVVLYLLSGDNGKADRAEALLKSRPTLSVQVLNEVTNVCVRKLGMTWEEVSQFLGLIRTFCAVAPLTIESHDLARRLAEHHQLAFYDANIVATACLAGCRILYSEDMHHGLIVDDILTLHNPFLA